MLQFEKVLCKTSEISNQGIRLNDLKDHDLLK